ncbi:MAG: GGDEF domain-containing protein [Lachnospiraceae bacterium]|nr:GGDEF domain-containing protein [Lachnospiraceae bacterium]
MKKKIAVFTTGWCSEILSQFLTGMQESLKDDYVDIFLFLCYPVYADTPEVKHGELNIFSLPNLNDFDGAVLFGSGLSFQDKIDELVKKCKYAGIPLIMQGAEHADAYYIGSDNYVATRDMCRHLSEKHDVHDIVFIAGTEESLDSELRLKAVRDHLIECGRLDDLKEVFYAKWDNAAVMQYINDYCKSDRYLPDAFICANDGLAMAACITLSENGYHVPDDVIVTGFDYIDDSQIFDPAIASVDQCFTAMGYACGQLWHKLSLNIPCERASIIPCEFVPGESCGCGDLRNGDEMRRLVGRDNFSKRSMTHYFNRKLNLIDSTVLSCLTYQEFKESLHKLLTENHDYEGDSFHVLLDPNFGLSIYDNKIELRKDGYSTYMEVIYSTEDGKPYEDVQFRSREMVPGYTGDGPNHLYVLLPLHESDSAYGYIVFRDCMDKVENHFLQTYQSRMGLVFDKFRHAISLDLLNKRLLELMRVDPLTNVNNRTAFEDKEKKLQSMINDDRNCEFGIAIFDVNDLKLINDNNGHDAGDAYLVRSCHLICNIFKHSPVYRVGGDEFVAVLMGEDYVNRNKLIKQLARKMDPYTDKIPLPPDYISIACGISVFDPENDMAVQDVMKRADEAMYENKAKIKGQK